MIENAIRDVLWGIIKVILIVGDWVYDMINTFISIDLSSNNAIWYVYGFGMLFLVSAVIIRLFFVVVHKMSDDEEDIDYSKIGKRIVKMFLVIALVPSFFTFSLGLPATINDIFTRNVSFGEPLSTSSAVLSCVAKTPLAGDIDELKFSDETVTIEVINEKINEEGEDGYKYFKGYGELFFAGIMGFLVGFSLLNVFLQIIERWFIQVFRLLVGFIPISSMVDPSDKSCEQWIRDIVSDVMVQTWSLLGLWFVFAIMESDVILSLNGIIRLFMFWIGISAISKIGNIIASYLQATDLAKPSHFGTALATAGLYGLAGGTVALGKKALGLAGDTALTAGAMGIQNIGERMGGKSMDELGLNPLTPVNGNVPASASFGTADTGSLNPLDVSPASSSESWREKLEEEKAAEKAEAVESSRLSRPDSFARSFADVAEQTPGSYGKVTRGISNLGGHLYVASAKRYNNSSLRTMQGILTKPSSNPSVNLDKTLDGIDKKFRNKEIYIQKKKEGSN